MRKTIQIKPVGDLICVNQEYLKGIVFFYIDGLV